MNIYEYEYILLPNLIYIRIYIYIYIYVYIYIYIYIYIHIYYTAAKKLKRNYYTILFY